MHQAPIDDLLQKLDTKYGLVIATAKRSRELIDGAEPNCEYRPKNMNKPVSIAIEEISEGKLDIHQPKTKIK